MPQDTISTLTLLDRSEVCRLFGGTKPINPATLYRGIKTGKYPRPVKLGPGTSRWVQQECERALLALIGKRN